MPLVEHIRRPAKLRAPETLWSCWYPPTQIRGFWQPRRRRRGPSRWNSQRYTWSTSRAHYGSLNRKNWLVAWRRRRRVSNSHSTAQTDSDICAAHLSSIWTWNTPMPLFQSRACFFSQMPNGRRFKEKGSPPSPRPTLKFWVFWPRSLKIDWGNTPHPLRWASMQGFGSCIALTIPPGWPKTLARWWPAAESAKRHSRPGRRKKNIARFPLQDFKGYHRTRRKAGQAETRGTI